MFDIFYLGDNPSLQERFPFAKQVSDLSEVRPRTIMYWLVEPNITITDWDVFEVRPEPYDQSYEHVYKWNSANYGGVRLLPRGESQGRKEVNRVVCVKTYDVLRQSDPGDYFDCHPWATHVWCVDPDYKISDTINWAPDAFEPTYIHTFHLRGQLQHKYPDEMGGVRLYPREWQTASYKIHGVLDAAPDYPVLRVGDPSDYSQRDHLDAEYVWLIDREHQIQDEDIDWVPDVFEDKYIHVFRMPYQLTHKYPMQMGGVRLVPRDWKNLDHKIHKGCPVRDVRYDVFYVEDDEFDADTLSDLAQRSRTTWFWVVDRDYEFNGDLVYVPSEGESEYIHIFKVPGQLEYRYDPTCIEPWDLRCGGVWLVHRDYDFTKKKYQARCPVVYDVFYTSDPKNHHRWSKVARSKMFWVVDSEYTIDVPNYVPARDEQKYALNFQIPNQLKHRYPEREGGVWLVPTKRPRSDPKYKGNLFVDNKSYPVLMVDDPSDTSMVTQDCWLVDREYRINQDTIRWAPDDFQKDQIHIFHVIGQLSKKYPDRMGGVRWVPVNRSGEVTVHGSLDLEVDPFPAYVVDDPTNHEGYSECWLIDREYNLDHKITVIPWQNETERNQIHVYHVNGRLRHKYPESMGGVYWVPKNPDGADVNVHREPIEIGAQTYPVIYVDDPSDTSMVTQDCWLVDRSYRFKEGSFDWAPGDFQKDHIHTFHVPNQLTRKYVGTMGGIRWVPKDHDVSKITTHRELPLDVDPFPAYLVDDPAKHEGYSECWLIDREYHLEPNIPVIPWQNEIERDQIHVYHANGRLRHKYPKTGGVYWVPKDPIGANINAHTEELELTPRAYPAYLVDDPSDYEGYSECWLIDRDYNLEPNISVTPWQNETERTQIHVYHANGRLRHKYPESMGGVYWVPKNPDGADINVHHEQLQLEPKQYPVHRVADPTNHEGYSECWLIDEDYVLDGAIAWSPEVLEQDQIHVFHIHGQLANKYPDKMGGAYWLPKNPKGAEINVHSDVLPIQVNGYPVYRVDDFDRIEDYSECWLVDSEYEIETPIEVIPWQNQTERDQIHVYRVHGQLEHKYPDTMGGAYWVPKHPHGADINVHTEYLPATPRQYPIYFVEDPADTKGYSECWLIDQDYEIDTEITWVPDLFERDQIHAFHVRGQLDHKYPDAIGGVRWVPKDPNNAKTNIHTEYLPVKSKTYKVVKTKTPADYLETGLRECWLIDEEYEISEDFEWTPGPFERDFVHVFHVPGQLEHKYPESMGGIYWLPKNPVDAEIKIHTDSPFEAPHFEIYQDEEEGRHNTSMEWFWVIDPGVELHQDFSLDFVPDVWDHGKTHVWQKLNPITGKVYDYGGVKLCPREPKSAGRPKYMRSPACTQREYPVYHIEPQAHTRALQGWYEARAREAQRQGLDAFWVVDTYTQLDPQWEFDFYPTQWDRECVHVFEDDQGRFRSVRWVPVSTFLEAEYTDKEIATNSFPKLKEVRRRASVAPDWPVVQLPELNRDALYDAIRSTQAPFVVTVDPHVDGVLDGVTSFMPEPTDLDRVHIWQRENPRSGKVWGYGGVRLWPTQRDYQDLTSESVRTNRLKGVRYVKSVGARDHAYDIVFISYHEPHAEERYKELSERFPGLLWVKDVDGIFEAHKRAAELASTPMFWVVDGDAEVEPDFGFDYMADPYDRDVVHVWNSYNPVTGDTYGYGGIKLFPTHLVRSATSWGLDFTTGLSSRYKEMPETASTTRINGSAWDAWRSGFREAAKLALKSDSASKKRLEGWLHPVPDAYFRHDAKRGAEEGRAFALANKNKPDELAKINSREFLEEQYGHEI